MFRRMDFIRNFFVKTMLFKRLLLQFLFTSIGLLKLSFTNAQVPIFDKQLIVNGLTRPTKIVGAENRLFIAEMGGKIKILKNGSLLSTPFLDISSKVLVPAWQGIYSMAFHPDYPATPYFYVLYFNKNDNYQATLSRFSRDSQNGDLASTTEEVLLKIPYINPNGHLGGDIAFGTDGYLYITTGDNAAGGRGDAGDPQNNSQSLQSWFGKMLRIDVNNGTPYGIPPSNPFLTPNDQISDEIWANGLRNPWRFSFDHQTGELWIGDNGQDGWEEVDVVIATNSAGSNFGWRCYEGNAAYNQTGCGNGPFVQPTFVFAGFTNNGGAAASVIGGYVYRGRQFPSLRGWYAYADYGTGNIFLLKKHTNGSLIHGSNYVSAAGVVSFGEDTEGELYFCTFYSGELYKLILSNCQNSMLISGLLSDNYTLNAQNTIEFENSIEQSGSINAKAGKSILLKPNFEVKEGSVFKTSIEGCN